MATVTFGSKAETLARLKDHITTACIPRLAVFSVGAYRKDPLRLVQGVQEEFPSTTVVVRSSAKGEDGASHSHAGEFCSVLNVSTSDASEITRAIDSVIESYDKPSDDDQFFIQIQVKDIVMSGVVFTRELDSLAPYITINYDESGSTDSVTSGRQSQLRTYVRARSSDKNAPHYRLQLVLSLCQQLESVMESDALDIEFAISAEEQVYLLQVRKIAAKNSPCKVTDERHAECLLKIYKKIQKLNAPHPGLLGARVMYSVMTDWNPAEMIGIRPRTLALSLYKELITDSIWAYQRHNYGYRNLRSFPLLISFLGLPYIDVRASFNSFVPESLDPNLAARLVDYYIRTLEKVPAHHDKVEFNIIFSCYYLNLPQRLKKLLHCGFSELDLDRIKFSLLNLTNNIVSPTRGLYREDLQRVAELEKRIDRVVSSNLYPTDKVYWLIEDCKRYGTLPFAGLARAGFIAVQFLQSFVDVGILTQNEVQQYMNSLDTVASKLSRDFSQFSEGKLSREMILQAYGHLRPGTYDILSPRYDEAFDLYFSSMQHQESRETASRPFSEQQMKAIEQALVDNGIQATAEELLSFIKAAIEGREYSKFVFTKSLSQTLRYIEQLGGRFGFDRDAMSFVNIRTILDFYSNLEPRDLPEILKSDIEVNRAMYEVTKAVRLPQLLTSEAEVYDFFVGEVEPNFVTLSSVTNIIITEDEFPSEDLQGKIVFIRSADPGYDWIFSRQIGGLVTMYGGANSHMAIRCAELQIPAVIGCGEKNFEEWSQSNSIEIDCVNRRVRALGSAANLSRGSSKSSP